MTRAALLALVLAACAHAQPPPVVQVRQCLTVPPPTWAHVPESPCPAGSPAGMACFADADGRLLAQQIAAVRAWAADAWRGCGADGKAVQ